MVENIASDAWRLFDVVASQRLHDVMHGRWPWTASVEGPVFEPDLFALEALLAIPPGLRAKSTSGVPALAVDVWVAHELRRAGFDPDAVWPRQSAPRVLPAAIARLAAGLPSNDRKRLLALLGSGRGFGGATSASARILGKNYYKQVDVGMSDWDTGPELLISTKRMDASFSRNAPNRVEESYGDARNLRLRHPQSGLGLVFLLRHTAFEQGNGEIAAWIVDLLAKLGRNDDAYDAVCLIVPEFDEPDPLSDYDGVDPLIEAGLQTDYARVAGEMKEAEGVNGGARRPVAGIDSPTSAIIRLRHDLVPDELSPTRFFTTIVNKVLDNTPINRHVEARRRKQRTIDGLS